MQVPFDALAYLGWIAYDTHHEHAQNTYQR